MFMYFKVMEKVNVTPTIPSPERVSFSLGLLIFDPPHPPTCQRLLLSYQTKNYMDYFIECTISLKKYNMNMFPFGPEILY